MHPATGASEAGSRGARDGGGYTERNGGIVRWLLWLLIGCGGESEPPRDLAPPKDPPKKAVEPIIDDEPEAGMNRPPKINEVLFQPEHPVRGQSIQTRVLGEDPDGDDVEIDLVWVVNGDRWLDQTERTLDGARLVRGDVVQVEVTVSDGTNTVTETSRKLEVGNTPPELLTTRDEFADLDGLQIRAKDPDGDRLSYRLEGAPDGLEIDEDGRLSYQGSESAAAGTWQVTLVVDDGNTGTAKLGFGLTVSAGQAQQRVKKGSEAASGEATGGEAAGGDADDG